MSNIRVKFLYLMYAISRLDDGECENIDVKANQDSGRLNTKTAAARVDLDPAEAERERCPNPLPNSP